MTNKLIFLGTPSFSANILQGLIKKGLIVSSVITGTDKKQGRGYAVTPSEVSNIAKELNLPTFKPTNICELRNILEKEQPDLCLVIAYGMIFPPDLVNKYNFINIHSSLLPKYRGPSPVQSCLLNGDKTTGVTLMKIGEGIDDGDIIISKTINIEETDNSQTLFKKLEQLSIDLLLKELPQKTSWNYVTQNHQEATFTKKIKKDDGFVDFIKDTPQQIHNKHKAYYPWPGIYTFQDNKRIKILELKLINKKLDIITVQKEGKNPITYKEFLNSNQPLI